MYSSPLLPRPHPGNSDDPEAWATVYKFPTAELELSEYGLELGQLIMVHGPGIAVSRD